MAKTSYIDIPEEFDLSFRKTLTSGDRFTFPNVRRKVFFTSRSRRNGLTEKSLMPQIAAEWAALSSGDKDAWSAAGDVNSMTGWRAYFKDRCLRIKNDLIGASTPSSLHLHKVGRIEIMDPASSILIAQLHPRTYWVSRKVRGTRDQREPVLVTEDFALPLDIGISYKSDLQSTGAGSRVSFYVIVYSHYQGRTIENRVSVNMGLQDDWTRGEATLNACVGLSRSYTAFIELYNVEGNLYFDNVSIGHSGQNWARDPFCNDINQGFTKAFYQVPKHWVAVDIPEGAQFESFYYN